MASAIMPRTPRLVRSEDREMALRMISASTAQSRSNGCRGKRSLRKSRRVIFSSLVHSLINLLAASRDSLTWAASQDALLYNFLPRNASRELCLRCIEFENGPSLSVGRWLVVTHHEFG